MNVNLNNMIHLYYILTLIITAIAAFNAPYLIMRYDTYKARLKRKRDEQLRNVIREEIKNILIELKNQ